MGHLIYDGRDYAFEDRLLAHLKVAVGMKLRRQESFFLNWIVEPQDGSGRISLWFAPTQHVGFRFAGSRPPELNKDWIQVMIDLANTPRGLVVMTEQEAEKHLAEQTQTST